MAYSFDDALKAEGIEGSLADLARSIYAQESGSGRNTTTSSAGAVGGMQIITSTFSSVADKGWDITNPEHNTRAGLRYIKQLDKLSGGDPRLTAIGYYGGPGGIEKARRGKAVSGGEGFPDTFQYADQVLSRLGKPYQVSPAMPLQAPISSVAASLPPSVPTLPDYLINAPMGTILPSKEVIPSSPQPVLEVQQQLASMVPQRITPSAIDFLRQIPSVSTEVVDPRTLRNKKKVTL